jgi:resuscitation-promoting factor RpfB
MKAVKLILAVSLLGALAGGVFYLTSSKTYLLVQNGQERLVRSKSWRVAGVIGESGISIAAGDLLFPPPEQRLWGGETIRLEQASQIWVLADKHTRRLTSIERVPAKLLSLAKVSLNRADQVLVDGEPVDPSEPLEFRPALLLEVRRAVPVSVHIGGDLIEFTSTAATVGRALWEHGIHLRAGDRVDPALITPLSVGEPEGLEVTVRLGRELSIVTGSETIRVYSSAETVADLLAAGAITLQGLDYSIPEDTALLPPEGQIRVVRVREEVLVEQLPLPFETEFAPLPELELDKKQVIETGEYGLTARQVRVVYEDGVEISRQVEDEWEARPAKNRVLGYGTKVVMHTLDTPDGTINYWRSLQMWATSYHPAVTSNRTASGMPLQKGVAAVDTSIIPFYTRMYVPGYGEAVAADVGGGVRGRMIDLGYSDHDYVSWARWVTVYFLWPPPENIVWNVP